MHRWLSHGKAIDRIDIQITHFKKVIIDRFHKGSRELETGSQKGKNYRSTRLSGAFLNIFLKFRL